MEQNEIEGKGMLKKILGFVKGGKIEGTKKGLLKKKEFKERLLIGMVILAFAFELIVLPTLGYVYYTNINKLNVKNGFVVNSKASAKVVVVDFNEEIKLGTYHKIYNLFEKLKDDDKVEEIVLIMNSPGGSPAASEEISEYLKSYKSKKITLYIQTLAASGGYYIASVFDEIIANPNAIVGSIGVIMPKLSMEKLSKTIGIEEDPIIAGKYKKSLSLFKKTDDETKKYIEDNLLIPTYDVFLRHVSENRGIPMNELKDKYAEGRVFSASHELVLGKLIDKIQNFPSLQKEIVNRLLIAKNFKDSGDISFHFIMLNTIGEGGLFSKGVGIDLNVNANDIVQTGMQLR